MRNRFTYAFIAIGLGAAVTLTVTAEDHPASLADLAGRISADDAQEMCAIVEREFERVDLRESQ